MTACIFVFVKNNGIVGSISNYTISSTLKELQRCVNIFMSVEIMRNVYSLYENEVSFQMTDRAVKKNKKSLEYFVDK